MLLHLVDHALHAAVDLERLAFELDGGQWKMGTVAEAVLAAPALPYVVDAAPAALWAPGKARATREVVYSPLTRLGIGTSAAPFRDTVKSPYRSEL